MPLPHVSNEDRWLHGTTDESGHRGKGPKNYHRSDQRVFEDVCEELSQHDNVDASDIEVTVSSGEVVLDGTVATQRMKEHIEEIVTAVAGVKTLRDLLRTRSQAQ